MTITISSVLPWTPKVNYITDPFFSKGGKERKENFQIAEKEVLKTSDDNRDLVS